MKNINLKEFLKKILKNKVFIIIILLLIPILFEMMVSGKNLINPSSKIRILHMYVIYVLICIFNFLSKKCNKLKKIVDFIMKYRYTISIVFLIILVSLNVNFSSIEIWNLYLNENESNNVIYGNARKIRSDEWLTQSSFMIGQALNKDGYKAYSENIGQGNGNMLMISAPVSDIVEIARPLLWGFHFLNVEHGFSFYWVLKVIALIMVSIEIVKKLTNGNNLLSLSGGLILAFAPPMMWWLSTAVVDGYIYGMATIILVSYYMNNLNWEIWKKVLLAMGIMICLPGFVFMLYPAFQVPFGFFMIIVMLHDLIKNRKKLKKIDYILIGATIVISLGLVLRFIAISWNAIQLMMNTVYPGKRTEVGGTFTTDNLIANLLNIFFPSTNKIENTCEPSMHIYPFTGLIIIIIAFLKDFSVEKNKERFGIIIPIIALYIIYLIWEYIGFPESIAKLSLLSFSPANRIHVITGILGTLLTIMMLQKISVNKKFTKIQGIAISLCIVVASYVLIKQSTYAVFLNSFIEYEIVFTIIFTITYFFIMGKKKEWVFTMCIIAIISGATVNPISIGIAPITKTEIAENIRKIAEEDKNALWMADSNITGQYLIANNVKCLNGVNTYPNFKWLNLVDPDNLYNEVYNRFAHIGIKLGEKTEFQLIAQDAYNATLTYKNIKDINAKYYFTLSKISDDVMKEFNLKEIYSNIDKNQYIYLIE